MTAVPAMVVTLTGTSHLVGYVGASALAVRRFVPERGAGYRCLTGPYSAISGEPTRVLLKPPTRAVLITARSADPQHSAFVPLLPAPGRSLRIPLPSPPVEPGTEERLTMLFDSAPWIFASSYAHSAPHHYTRRSDWPDTDVFTWMVQQIQRHGHRRRFGMPGAPASWWQQLDIGAHTHWGGYETAEQHRWVNRRELGERERVPLHVRDQALVVEDAELLDVPGLLGGEGDRYYELGCALFGDGRRAESAARLFPEGPP